MKLEAPQLAEKVVSSLADLKGRDIRLLDVRGKSSFTDFMVIVSATSDRHLRSLAQRLVDDMKQFNVAPLGTEGEDSREWVLVDFVDVLVHVMLPEVRDHYQLEQLWGEWQEGAELPSPEPEEDPMHPASLLHTRTFRRT